MKLLLSELYKYLSKKISESKIIDSLTKLSFEVEDVSKSNKVTGNAKLVYVKKCVKHKNADRLKVCEIISNSKSQQVICGASNIKKDSYVFWAPPKSKVGDFILEEKDIRGIKSKGMILSYSELSNFGKEINNYLPQKEIMEFSKKEFDMKKDPINYLLLDKRNIDVTILPDRIYALNYLMLAKEISVFLSVDFKIPKIIHVPKLKINIKAKTSDEVNSIFAANIIYDKKIDTPWYVKSLLYSSKIRVTNTIVDFFSYAQVLFGTPFFIFDKTGNVSLEGEVLKVDKKSVNILSYNNNLIFEKGKEYTVVGFITSFQKNYASNKELNHTGLLISKGTRNCFGDYPIKFLLNELHKSNQIKDYSNLFSYEKDDSKTLKIKKNLINQYIGEKFDLDLALYKLSKIDLKSTLKEKEIIFEIPKYRSDVNTEQDLIEEIIRILGIDNFKKSSWIKGKIQEKVNNKDLLVNDIKDYMLQIGAMETNTYNLWELSEIKKYNIWNDNDFITIDDQKIKKSTYISSLLKPLLKTYVYNSRKDLEIPYFFFEIKNIYLNSKQTLVLGMIYDNLFFEKFIGMGDEYDPLLFSKQNLINIIKKIKYTSKFKILRKEERREIFSSNSGEVYIGEKLVGVMGELSSRVLREQKLIRIDKVKRKLYYSELKIDEIMAK